MILYFSLLNFYFILFYFINFKIKFIIFIKTILIFLDNL